MALDEIPLFAMLRGRLGYLSERQRLIAENVANADTPGYAPRDLKPFSVVQAQAATLTPVAPAMTSAMHLTGSLPKARNSFKPQRTADSETTLDGNSVVLEEEMMKLTQARMDYEAAIGFYQKSLGLLRLATRKPGAG
ncbi:MAG TPA: flagellar basal body rod protein FlgB [Caulobacteraceae bacterium]|jgi:flagellar basal-body rod protein FlgB|nr:flagellar basal body rod protein FlgB [Caulobacteraceae bacterium]